MTGARVRARVDYPGRVRVDGSLAHFRRSVLRLARLASEEEAAAVALARLVDDFCETMDRFVAGAEQAVLHSERGQNEVRREVAKAERLVRRAASPAAQQAAEQVLADVRKMLAAQDLDC